MAEEKKELVLKIVEKDGKYLQTLNSDFDPMITVALLHSVLIHYTPKAEESK